LVQLRPFLAQNASLAFEADVLRKQKINSIYQPAEFFPAESDPVTFWFSSPQVVLDKLSAVSHKTAIPKNPTYIHEISIGFRVIRQCWCPSQKDDNSSSDQLLLCPGSVSFRDPQPACHSGSPHVDSTGTGFPL